MLVLLLGVGFLIVGIKGLTAKGLPITTERRLTGPWAKVVGVVCIAAGASCVLFSLVGPFLVQ